jgi:hypothetical protein
MTDTPDHHPYHHPIHFVHVRMSRRTCLLAVPSSLTLPYVQDPAGSLFFRLAHPTSPAQRVKKAPSRRPRPPAGPPRSPKRPLRVFDPPLNPCWSLHAIETSTPLPGGTYGG